MRWSLAFIELVLPFAGRVAEVGQMPIAEALLTSTPLYMNFDLSPPFNAQHPVWQEFLLGFQCAADPVAWTHSFYLDHARPYPAGTFGCFSYHYESEQRTIRFHFFANSDVSGPSPLSTEREPVRRQELTAMFTDIRREVPEAETVRGRSWAYNLPAYRRLFPPAYVQSAVPVEPELQFMSLWGQFLDRHWELRPESARIFRVRTGAAATLDALLASFPLPVLAPRCAIERFYAFYGVE